MEFAVYKQTTHHTCADCSYMVAMNELLGDPMSRDRELHLWDAVVPALLRPLLKDHVGTPPVFLASYIQNTEPTIDCRLVVYNKNVSQLKERRQLIGSLSSFHDFVMDWFLPLNPPALRVHRRQKVSDVKRLLGEPSQGVRLLQVVVLEQSLVHFTVIRWDDQGHLVVMDPWSGTNTAYTEAEFTAIYGNLLYGYCFRLAKR